MTEPAPQGIDKLTLFMCGPAKNCEHEWSEEIVKVGDAWSVICKKCGRTAINEDAWI